MSDVTWGLIYREFHASTQEKYRRVRSWDPSGNETSTSVNAALRIGIMYEV